MLWLQAVQNGLEDSVGVVGEAPIRDGHGVDGTASGILQDTADVLQGLVRRFFSAVFFAFLGCGCYVVGVAF